MCKKIKKYILTLLLISIVSSTVFAEEVIGPGEFVDKIKKSTQVYIPKLDDEDDIKIEKDKIQDNLISQFENSEERIVKIASESFYDWLKIEDKEIEGETIDDLYNRGKSCDIKYLWPVFEFKIPKNVLKRQEIYLTTINTYRNIDIEKIKISLNELLEKANEKMTEKTKIAIELLVNEYDPAPKEIEFKNVRLINADNNEKILSYKINIKFFEEKQTTKYVLVKKFNNIEKMTVEIKDNEQ